MTYIVSSGALNSTHSLTRPAASGVYLFHDQIPSIYYDVHVCRFARGSAGYCRKRAYFIYLLFSKQHQSRLPEAIVNDVT